MATMLGSLLVSLGLESARFSKGLTKAQRDMKRAQQQFDKIGRKMAGIGKAFSVGITAPVLGAAAAIGKSAHDMAMGAREIGAAARAAGEDFQEFQRQAFAAKSVGIEFEKLGDIFKDVRDRVGDFVATGGGPMADFFDKISPKVEVTADAFKGLSGKDALQLYFDSLRKANVSQEEMVFYLEAMASDATDLIPLLEAGGAAFGELGAKASVISEEDKAALDRYNTAMDGFAASAQRLTLALVKSGLLDGITSLVERFSDWASKAAETNPMLFRVGVVAAGVAAAIGPLVIVAGSLVGAVGALAPLFLGLSAALGPVGLTVAAIAAAGALVYANWDKIGPVLDGLKQKFVEVLGPRLETLITTAKNTFDKLWNGPLGEKIREVIGWFGEFQATYLQVFGEVLVRALSVVMEVFKSTFEQIGNIFDLFSSLLKGDFKGAWEAAASFVDTAVKSFLRVIVAVFPEINDHVSALYTAVKKWLQDKLGAVFDWVESKVDSVSNTFFRMYDAVVGHSYVPDMVDGIRDEFNRLDAVMVKPAEKAATAVGDRMREMAQETKALLDSLFPEIAAERQRRRDLDLIEKSGLSDEDKTNARYRLAGGRDYLAPVSVSEGPLFEAGQVARASKRIADEMAKAADNTKVQTVRVAESFKDMAQNSIRALDDLVGAIQGGGFLDILGSVINLGLQLGGSGLFGSKVASRINSVPGFANGTSFAPGGLAVVGERGPELVNLPRGSQVIPNHELRAANDRQPIRIILDERTDVVSARIDDRIGAAAPVIVSASNQATQRSIGKRQTRRVA